MKNLLSKTVYALIFAILGFLLINRYLTYFKHTAIAIDPTDHNQLNVVSDIDSLKKEKEALEKESSDIVSEIKKYEENISTTSDYSAKLQEELDSNRKLLGLVDVTGQGITIHILPKSEIFNQLDLLDSADLYYIVNELFSASAEAITINDSRITSQSVISDSTNQQIEINDIVIKSSELITIKAIGNADLMEDDLINYNTLKFRNLKNHKITIKKSDDLVIPRYSLKMNTDGLNSTEISNEGGKTK